MLTSQLVFLNISFRPWRKNPLVDLGHCDLSGIEGMS
jgi:hypothetical protein